MGSAEDSVMADLCSRLLTQIQVTQSLTQQKDPKGQSMFKWHFDDISMARLTFGGFRLLCFCPLHYILAMQKIFSTKNEELHSHRQSADLQREASRA